MTPFEYLNAINFTKVNLLKDDPHLLKDYNSFIVNRGLSYFGDTVMYANEMNMHASIPKKWQFDFYLAGIKKKKRFSKWSKRESTSDDLKLIMQQYDYSAKRAQEALDMLTDDQLKSIRESYKTGGR